MSESKTDKITEERKKSAAIEAPHPPARQDVKRESTEGPRSSKKKSMSAHRLSISSDKIVADIKEQTRLSEHPLISSSVNLTERSQTNFSTTDRKLADDTSLAPPLKSTGFIKYMNSYRLDSKNPFRRESVYNIIRDVFQAEFTEMTYEPLVFSTSCAGIAAEIRTRVKALGFDRYKLICIVQICEKNKQSVNSMAKFLWDSDRDDCASYTFENMYFLASGAVFGLYFE